MKWRIGSILIFLLLISYGLSVPVNAAITGTEASAGMRIDGYSGGYFTDATDTDLHPTNASVSIAGNVTSATAFSTWQLTSLDSDSANLYLNFGFNGSGVCDPTWDPDCNRMLPSYLGQSGSNTNYTKIYYTANTDSELIFSWDLVNQGQYRVDYSGGYYYRDISTNVFPVSMIGYRNGNQFINTMQNFTNTIGLSDQKTFNLKAGNDYYFYIYGTAGTSGGGLDRYSRSISGNISIDFNNTVVPEPISSTLFIVGGALLAGRRYLKRKKKA